MSYSCLSELVEFEKRTARRRKQMQNHPVSNQQRLNLAKEPFKSKEDALERLLTYHNSYVSSTVNEIDPAFPSDLKERMFRLESTFREIGDFRNGLYGQALRSLKVEAVLPPPPMNMYQQQQLMQQQMIQQYYQQQQSQQLRSL